MPLKQISLLVLLITVGVYFQQAIVSGHYYGESDFFKFYEAVLFYFSGQDIYSNVIIQLKSQTPAIIVSLGANLAPPFLTVLLLPIYYFNYAEAFLIWTLILIVCLLLGSYLALRPFPQFHKHTLPIMALFMLYLPNAESLAYGQLTAVLLVLLTAAWICARQHKDISAGVCIGFLCALKLFCGLFLIYFLCLKRFRLVLTALAAILIAFLISCFVFGFQSYLSYHTILTTINWYGATWNASFYGFFSRLFHPVLFSLVCSVLLLSYLILFWKKWGNAQFDIGFSLVIVSMLLLSPLGWIYYFPLLLIPYLVLVDKGTIWTHLAACFLLFLSTLTGAFLRPSQITTISERYILGGIGFYVLLGLLGLLFFVAFYKKDPDKIVISQPLWALIYTVVFIPSMLALAELVNGLYSLCH